VKLVEMAMVIATLALGLCPQQGIAKVRVVNETRAPGNVRECERMDSHIPK
jgi:hypothetical protein